MPESTECALWYMVHGTAHVTVCDTEREAVGRAITMQEWETGAPDGVQFPDGTYMDVDDWPALEAEKLLRHEKMLREFRTKPVETPPALVTVISPAGRQARVELEDCREWMQRG